MIIFALMLTVSTLLWAALGFSGLGKRTGRVVRLAFAATIFVTAGVYSVAQATAP